MITLAQIEARTLRCGELLPAELMTQVGFQQLDSDWVWVATDEGDIVAALLVAPCHGVIMLARVVALPGHQGVLVPLFRRVVKDALARGYKGYLCWFGTQPAERRLAHILRRGGSIEMQEEQRLVGGSLTALERW